MPAGARSCGRCSVPRACPPWTGTPLRAPTSSTGTALTAHPAGTATPAGRPVEIALTAGCYLLWQQRSNAHPAEVGVWLQRALDSLAAELLNEVVTRCHEMQRSLTRSVARVVEPAAVDGPRIPAARRRRAQPSYE